MCVHGHALKQVVCTLGIRCRKGEEVEVKSHYLYFQMGFYGFFEAASRGKINLIRAKSISKV